MPNLSGRTALVTGASRGIGRAIAESLAAAGASVAVNYHRHQGEAESVVNGIQAAGGNASAFGADVANAASVDEMVRQIREQLGPITILVNNAALTDTHRPWKEITEADWDRVMDVPPGRSRR